MEAPAGVAAATAAAAAAAAPGAASSNSSANASAGGAEWWFPGPRSPYTPAEAVLIALVLLCVIAGTVVGNVLVCVAVCLVRKLRRPCNYLLVSLAVSDLCVALLVMPMALLSEIFGVWSFGPVACDLWVSFDVLSCTASILNLCMISVDRYYAITKPLEYGVRRTPRRMVASVALVWLGAACISLPPLLILGNEHEDAQGVPQCQVCQNFAYQIYATLGSFYIPLSVMIVVYYKIFRAARKIVLEERRAQSHLRAHSYLEISVGNGGGPPETRLAATGAAAEAEAAAAADGAANGNGAAPAAAPDERSSSPAVRAQQQQHRPSTTSTNTTCSGQTGSSTRCFATSSLPRRSNESQCPMLTPRSRSKKKAAAASPRGRAGGGGGGGGVVGLGAFRSRRRKPPPALALPVTPTGGGAASAPAALPPPSAGFSSQSSPPPRQTQQRRLRFALAKERKASTTLGIIMSAFTFCWLPFFVLALVRPFTDIPPSLSSLFLWLGYANSLFNPIIYATLNRDFRKPFQQILYFRCSSLNHMMREEFYHSQYGDPDHHQYYVINTAAAATGASCSGGGGVGGGGGGGGGGGARPLSAASGAAPSSEYREDDERLSAAGDGPPPTAGSLVDEDDDDDDDEDEERAATTALADESFL